MWTLSGVLVNATDRIARRYKKPGFAIAFFVLGMLTSISEISVATNATIEGFPQVSAGNLVGGMLVIFFLIIPILAVLGGGIEMNHALGKRTMLFLLAVVLTPAFFALDGSIVPSEGILMILLYIALLYVVQKRKPTEAVVETTIQDVENVIQKKRNATVLDILKVCFAAILIFAAGKLLVDESIYFSAFFSVPPSLMGLLLLSIGTNAPELVIAIRCALEKRKDIAFGDYMGSATANTLIMGFLSISNGPFVLEQSEFIPTFALLFFGLLLFLWFARSKDDLSKKEGLVLLGVYAFFLASQIGNIAYYIH